MKQLALTASVAVAIFGGLWLLLSLTIIALS